MVIPTPENEQMQTMYLKIVIDHQTDFTLSKSAANFKTLFETINSSLLCGFCSICKYKLICSVIKTEILRYLRLIFVPSVINRVKKHPNAHDQISASNVCCDCNCTESFNHSTLKYASKSSVKINAPDTMTSTERCGPRLYRHQSTITAITNEKKLKKNVNIFNRRDISHGWQLSYKP